MKKLITLFFLVLFLSSCTPAVERYCQSQGLAAGSANYNECLKWAADSESQFSIDRERCLVQAKITYPDSLYDHGRTIRTRAFDRRGPPYYYDEQLPADYTKNAELDRLRDGIIRPCMKEKNWHDPDNWQRGRKKN